MEEKNTDFEDFLRERHMEGYTGLDDDSPDHFDDWICDFYYEDWILYGNLFARKCEIEIITKIQALI